MSNLKLSIRIVAILVVILCSLGTYNYYKTYVSGPTKVVESSNELLESVININNYENGSNPTYEAANKNFIDTGWGFLTDLFNFRKSLPYLIGGIFAGIYFIYDPILKHLLDSIQFLLKYLNIYF